MTSETEGPAPEARGEGLEETASKARFARVLKPANATTPPPPPQPANSDVEGEAEAEPAPAQAWPLAWLRVVEPAPPAADDAADHGVVAAVVAAEPADADGVAHAFGRAMAAALDPDPAGETGEAAEPEGRAFYSVPVGDPPGDASAGEPEGPSAAGAGDEDAHAEAAEEPPAAEAQATAAAGPEEPPVAAGVYASRRPGARRPAPRAESPPEGRAGEVAPAAAAYLFYLAGFLVVPAAAGVAIAYNARRSAPAWLESHYLYLIRTFWIGLAGLAVGAALLFSGKLTLGGLLLAFLLIVWIEVRSALGFISLMKLRAFPRPRNWLF